MLNRRVLRICRNYQQSALFCQKLRFLRRNRLTKSCRKYRMAIKFTMTPSHQNRLAAMGSKKWTNSLTKWKKIRKQTKIIGLILILLMIKSVNYNNYKNISLFKIAKNKLVIYKKTRKVCLKYNLMASIKLIKMKMSKNQIFCINKSQGGRANFMVINNHK